MRRPLVWVAVTFLLGLAAQPLLPPLAWWLLTVIALGTCFFMLPLLGDEGPGPAAALVVLPGATPVPVATTWRARSLPCFGVGAAGRTHIPQRGMWSYVLALARLVRREAWRTRHRARSRCEVPAAPTPSRGPGFCQHEPPPGGGYPSEQLDVACCGQGSGVQPESNRDHRVATIGRAGADRAVLGGSPRPQAAAVAAMLVAIVGLGALRMAAERRLPRDHYRQVAVSGPALVEGVVASDPIWRAGAGHPAGQQMLLAVTAVGTQRAGGAVWLRQVQPAYPLRVGDRIRVRGTIRAPHPAAAPGEFDEARWLWLQGVEGVLEAARDDIEWIGPPRGWRRALCALFDAKHRALGLMRQLVDSPTAALLAALLAGDRTGLSRDTTALFVNTGTVHLLSVSGWHVTLIGGLLWGLACAARCPRRPAAVVTMIGLLLYCLLTGAQPPIVRATLTGFVLLVGLCLTRPADPLNSLGLAAFLLLAAAPRALWDIGFQLSFASVVALLMLVPLGRALGQRFLAARPPLVRGPVCWLRDALVVSTAAWLGTWPLVAWHLHRITLVSWLANLLAVPLAALLMVTGLVVLLGVWWHPWLAVPWAGAAQLSAHTLLGLLARCAALPGATVPCEALPWWGLLGWYVGLLAAVLSVNRTNILKECAGTS